MDIKQKIIELCNDMIIFWRDLKIKMESTPNEDKSSVICEWHNHFIDHSCIIGKLGATKMNIEEIEEQLIMRQELRYED